MAQVKRPSRSTGEAEDAQLEEGLLDQGEGGVGRARCARACSASARGEAVAVEEAVDGDLRGLARR